VPTIAKLFLILGAANAALGVVFGAFGAHALKARLPAELLAVYQTGVHYHLFHALGLLIVGLMATQLPASGYLKWSGGLMLAGIVLFSGSLYLLSVAGWRALGMVTPFGGVAFMAAWVMFTVAVLKAD
jgi:uncharacterized membrane protein YgdD (TMEM256/DUF423 family)